MSVTRGDVEKVAVLARLSFLEEEKEKLTAQLNRILEYMEQLNRLDTEHVEPTSHVLPIKNVFREDRVESPLPRDELLANAPSQSAGYFQVPRVIE